MIFYGSINFKLESLFRQAMKLGLSARKNSSVRAYGPASLPASDGYRICIEAAGMRGVDRAPTRPRYVNRGLVAHGHDVWLMSPEYVRPYVKAQKNNDRDAEAIVEASAARPCASWRSRTRRGNTCRHSIASAIDYVARALGKSLAGEAGMICAAGHNKAADVRLTIVSLISDIVATIANRSLPLVEL